MDLYSAAKRLTKPFIFTEANREAALPIGARGIIGDGFTCALVRIDGAIDWLCMPRFDSPTVFASLLDETRGGITAIAPLQRPFESLQRYDPDTNVLETLMQVNGHGVVRLTDFMPWTDDPRLSIHEVHRRVECVEGEVDLEAIFDPRFDYATEKPRIDVEEHGLIARSAAGPTLVAVLGNAARWEPREQGGMRARFRLRRGERCWMVLSWNSPRAEPIAAYRPFELLRATRHRWREWSRGLSYDGPWRHHVMRSALLLKLLMYAPTGAMVAAATTSLPEWIGGTRNWDYRFSWSRDSAMGIRAATICGFLSEGRDFFHFVRDILEHTEGLQVMYTVDGQPVPDERILTHLAGYQGSAPVRIGNGARDQVQLDTAGAVLDAAYLYERFGGSLTLRAWRRLSDAVEKVRHHWRDPDQGIWEPRTGPRHNVHSKLMSWLALDRGAKLAPLFGGTHRQADWLAEAQCVRDDLLAHGMDAKRHHFVMAYGVEVPDAAVLQMPLLGFIHPADPAMRRTVDWIRTELGSGPFLHRYRFEDGVGGDEGAFVLCGFWLAEVLAMAGRLEEAQDVFVAHAEASNHLGLLAEEVHPGTFELLGNFPQAFSHLGLINAAARIDAALRLRDEGLHKVPDLLLDSTLVRP